MIHLVEFYQFTACCQIERASADDRGGANTLGREAELFHGSKSAGKPHTCTITGTCSQFVRETAVFVRA